MSFESQEHFGKLQSPVDQGVSAGLRPHEMAPMITAMPSPSDTPTNSMSNESNNLTISTTSTTKPPETLENPGTPEYTGEESRNTQNTQNTQNTHNTQNTPRTQTSKVTLGYLGINDRPEEARPPVVYGKINGRTARIMLDCGCSTYILSTDFVNDSDIPCFSCKPIPIELAV